MGQVHYQIYRARDGWRWRLWSSNGRIIADSGEAYTSHSGAISAVEWMKQNAHLAIVV